MHAYPVILQLDPVNPDMSTMGAILFQTNTISSYEVKDDGYGKYDDRAPRVFTEVSYLCGNFFYRDYGNPVFQMYNMPLFTIPAHVRNRHSPCACGAFGAM